jgi:hypothetical protein
VHGSHVYELRPYYGNGCAELQSERAKVQGPLSQEERMCHDNGLKRCPPYVVAANEVNFVFCVVHHVQLRYLPLIVLLFLFGTHSCYLPLIVLLFLFGTHSFSYKSQH